MTYGRTTAILSAALALASCSSPAVTAATDLDFTSRLIQRAEAMGDAAEQPAGDHPPSGRQAVATPPAKGRADEWRGFVDIPVERVQEIASIAADDAALTKALNEPTSLQDLAALAVLRSPEVRQARANYAAARTAFAQSRDLGDLVRMYGSFTRDLRTRVGPERSRTTTETIAPSPNVNTLSAEIAHRTADMAFESLRATIRDVVARAWRAHADAARLHEARTIVREEVDLDDVLLEVLRSRLEAGEGSQAGFLAFQSRLERLRTELAILDRRETVVRAQWNRLLARPESAPIALEVAPTPSPGSIHDEDEVVELAARERQELRAATLATERAELAVRLGETMTLPRMDVGSSRFERERTGEAGIQRGTVFPEPGRMTMPRADFGVREAQVQEMRSRAASQRERRAALGDRVATETRTALFGLDASTRRLKVHEDELVPLARDSLEAARGAYEGNRTGYLDLLDAVRRLLDARLGLADARRDTTHASAALLQAVGAGVSDRR